MERPYLLVLFRGSSSRVELPDGDIVIGSGADAGLRIDEPDVAPVHAVLHVSQGEVVLEAARPVVVDDLPVSGRRQMFSGETLAVGSATIALHGRPAAAPREPVDPAALRARLRVEIERCARTGAALAVLVVNTGDGALEPPAGLIARICRALRLVDVVGWDGASQAIIILPGVAAAVAATRPAARVLGALAPVAPLASAGFAICPADGHDADGLVAGARDAARAARPGEVLAAQEVARRVSIGGYTALVADPAVKRLLGLVERLAPADLPVLVTGETGVGKELFARALHEWSQRRNGPFVAVNCAAVTETLFESELFGYERGAFTDASRPKPGLVESAAGGTLMLDEVAECPPRVQAKLLRVLETRRVARVGSVTERTVDVRFVAATNRDLSAEVAAGRFRQDLYFRLAAARVVVPPLRDRPLDVPVLARAFLEAACAAAARPPLTLSGDALRRLSAHDWPGNVRELKNLMELCARTVDGDTVEARHLPPNVAGGAPWLSGRGGFGDGGHSPGVPAGDRRRRTLREEVRDIERTRMMEALAETGGVRVRAAELLGMPLRTFVAKMREHRIDFPPARGHGRGGGQ